MKRFAVAALLAVLSLPALAIDPAPPLSDPVKQQRYVKLTHELKCLQCQGETIADTPAQFAVDIRRQIREMLEAGKSDSEILQFFFVRYGDIILLKPRTIWLWLAPGVFLLGGIAIAWRIMRKRRDLLATDDSEVTDEAERT